ncbi:MAG TPA: hypothetical protein VK110_09115 [Salinisphaeraceae bacterium]|nr:hypothetical protein [Salinisphaeraceae bacterium]
MAYLNDSQLARMGFKQLGSNVKISEKASIYNPEAMTVGDNCRIDDFSVLSGRIEIGRFVYVAPLCLLNGGRKGLFLSDFVGVSYGARLFSQSDNYNGQFLTNPLIPEIYRKEIITTLEVGRHVPIGAGAVILPGAHIADGCAIGAMSLVLQPTEPWGIYHGIPARRQGERKQDLLQLERQFLAQSHDDAR